MRASSFDLDRALQAGHGVISRRQHPELVSQLQWQARRGTLRRVLPGVYCRAEETDTVALRILAASLWHPEAVLVGSAAARASFWPTVAVSTVVVAGGTKAYVRPGFRLTRRVVPSELVRVRGPLRFTDPALTALDLCDTIGGDGIDTALRTRAATLAGMRIALALTGGRTGNRRRRELLLDSRDEPWSAAERVAHRLLREAHLTGWVTNHPVRCDGQHYFIDIAFPARRLAIEIDGRLHAGPDLFESDRWRQNDLVLAGWRVLRFTWAMLTDHPDDVLAAVRAELRRSVLPVRR